MLRNAASLDSISVYYGNLHFNFSVREKVFKIGSISLLKNIANYSLKTGNFTTCCLNSRCANG